MLSCFAAYKMKIVNTKHGGGHFPQYLYILLGYDEITPYVLKKYLRNTKLVSKHKRLPNKH